LNSEARAAPNQRMQLAGAGCAGTRAAAERRGRDKDHRFVQARACRPQLMRDPLGSCQPLVAEPCHDAC
jgi:hypothetical protein